MNIPYVAQYQVPWIYTNENLEVGNVEMLLREQWDGSADRALAAQADNLSSIPGTHVKVERKYQFH